MDQYQIVVRLTQHDDGYRIPDWFNDDGACLGRLYDTPAEADAGVRAQYKGADVDGVEVRWTVTLAEPI